MKLFLSILIVMFFLSTAFGKAVHSVSNTDNANSSNEPKLYCIGGLCPTGFECDAKLDVCLPAKSTSTKVIKLD
ncbi:hypothetical protein L596_029954 [Steinernema carpocapsae]|uniref:CC domain-containing protein n=1 Tax=Steinernema carpocapsae TaxID=34508 RepID=A0A4U5LRB4_STECR|nr:hypothetical protein L596_029954 [Steinernema carpocapsae]